MNAEPVLGVRALDVGYDGVPVVQSIDLAVAKGEVVALLGANGAGKTTLLHTLAGLVKPVRGDVVLDGDRLAGPLHARARRGVGLVTEERAIIRSLTARENLKLSRGSIDAALEFFPELSPILDRRAGLLSGGEQQMLVLARVLASRARLLLVDELSFGLAPLIVQRLLGALRQAARDGAAVLVVEQHPALILSTADRGYVLGQGRVQFEGRGDELLERLSEIEEVYMSKASAARTEHRGA